MKYVIRNNKNLYIRLNCDGKPVSCTEYEKMLFDYKKAKNILDNLPKTMKKFHFKCQVISDEFQNKDKKIMEEKNIIQKQDYIVSDNILRWVEKFGICDDILKEAQIRKKELIQIISNYDRAVSNWVHSVELEKKKNACAGYKKYSDIKDIVDRRRSAKDELIIINNVLKMDFRQLDRGVIHKAVLGLAKRKFTYRVVEEDDTENVV